MSAIILHGNVVIDARDDGVISIDCGPVYVKCNHLFLSTFMLEMWRGDVCLGHIAVNVTDRERLELWMRRNRFPTECGDTE
ncbi:hypothetical protein DRQ26_07170 [bacterium]|nr:MAG: hypothetical protein DRQ26_07170 [bacterium]